MTNITIKEYTELKDVSEYDVLVFLKPKPIFGVHEMDVRKMTYEEVKSVTRTLRNFKDWNSVKNVFETCFKIDALTFWSGSIVDYFKAKNYIVKTFSDLLEREQKLLQSISKDSVLWEAAGGKRLDKFSDVLPLNQLGKIYGIYPFELKDYLYEEILLLLTIETVQNQVENKFNELKK